MLKVNIKRRQKVLESTMKKLINTDFLWFCEYILLPSYICTERVRVVMFNVTFNNISAISSLSVLLVEETGVPGVNNRPFANH